jgi:hypothetical protein
MIPLFRAIALEGLPPGLRRRHTVQGLQFKGKADVHI